MTPHINTRVRSSPTAARSLDNFSITATVISHFSTLEAREFKAFKKMFHYLFIFICFFYSFVLETIKFLLLQEYSAFCVFWGLVVIIRSGLRLTPAVTIDGAHVHAAGIA